MSILNLGHPDYAGQIFQIGQRLQALEARFAVIEPAQAGYDARLTVVEGGGPPASITNTAGNTMLTGNQVSGFAASAQSIDARLTVLGY